MWKAAFTGRSEKGGDRERDSASVVGRSDARRKKSSRSSRGDVDDTASMVSGTSRRHRSSRHESSSRYGDDDDDGRVKSSSRHGDEDRDRMRDSSSYYSGPPSVYGSAASYASPASGSYATSPTSRVSGETRALTASALRMLPDEGEGDEDAWEDDEKTVKSERRKKRRSSSDEREKRRKSTGKEKERKRSSSRERKEKKRSSTAEKSKEKASSSSRRSEPKLVAESSRAIPAMGSFEQFPGQYNGGVMGQPQQDYTMSGALPNVVPSAQFPGQDVPVPDQQPAPPMGISRADSYGHAADYYMDEGQSVAHQPGNRASTPNMLVNPQHHLVAASAVPVPAQDTGNGSAADYFNNNNVSYSAPVTPARPTAKPSKQSSSSASKPSKSSSKLSKPSRTSSGSAVAAGLTGVAAASALSGFGNGKASSSHRHSQSEYSTSSSYQQQPSSGRSDYPPTLPAMTSQSRPSRQSDGSIYYAVPANGAGPSLIGSSAYGPNYENTYGTGNVQGKTTNHSNAGMYAAGAAAAGAAAYGIYQHQHGRTDSNTAVAGGFGGGGQGPPPPGSFGAGSYYPSSGSGGGMMQQGHFHEHKGPMTKLKDGLLNLISTPEDVAKMEMYTEYIGVCKYCFDPRTSAWDAPRVHHYHKRRDSFESLRRRASRNKLQRKGSNERVDKESRYDASDSSRRRREERHSGMGLPGAGLAAVGTGLAANALFNHRNNFDDTYSVQSGHRESSAMRRRSRSSSREKRRQSQHGTIRPCGDEFRNVTIRRKDGTIEHRRVARSRSGSGDRKSGFGLGTAAAAGAALGAASLAASVRRRSRSSSRERKRHSGRTSDGRSDYSRYESDGRRQSAEGGGGIFGNFFSPPRKSRRGSREHQKKRAGFFTFSNDSASSANSDLAFGGSALSRKTSKSSLSRRSSNRSTRGRLRQKSSDQQLAATLAGIGATAAALSAAKAGHRISKRTSRPELGARRQVRQQVVGDHRQGSPGSSEEEGWEDELPSDDASSNDGLAFGDYGGKRLSGRQSLESVASQSSAGGLGAWGWRWGGKDKKRKSRRSTSGEVPYPTTEYGSAVGPIAAGIAGGGAGAAASSAFDASRPVHPDKTVYLDDSGRPLPTVDSRSSVSGHSSQPLQLIDPQPLSETGTPRQQSVAGGFTTPTRVQYMPGAFETDEPPIYRPGPGVVQHPQPMSPARPAFTQAGAEAGYTATAGAANGRPAPRRSQSSPVPSSWGQDAALIGAGVLGAGAIIAGSALSSGRKSKDSPANVRFGLTEEQQRREKRSDKQDDKRADEERRRADRTRALKEEAERAAKKSSEQEVLRAREAENRARAQAQLDLQREQERKEAEEARIRAEQQAREEREQRAEIERLERAAAERQAAAASAAAEFERQRKAREEAERRQAEVERQNREREEALRRQQYELAEEARREDEQRRQWEAERYAREYQQSARRASGREPFESPRGRSDDGKQSSGWSTVAAGAAAAAGVGAVIATRDGKKRRQSGKSDSTEESPISRRPPRTSVDWNADAFTDERDAAEQAELDRQAREQYGYASRGNVERKDGYAATEIKPGGAEEGEPIMDDDIFDPDFFMRSQHTPADRAKHEELARKAADKVVADRARAYSPDSRPKENYADFFADEVKDMLAKKPGEKERNIQPDSDVQVYHVEEYGATPPFALRNDLGGKSKHAPYGVPRLNVIAPTPPPGSKTTSTKGSVPSSPLSKAVDGGAEHSPDSAKDSGKSDRSRSISWGEDEVNVYDVQTPESFQEKDRDSYITSPDLRKAGNGVAAAAGVAGAATVGSALHDIVVEDGNNTKSYKEEEFSPASSKKGKKDKKKAKKGFKSNADDADASFLDELSDKAKKSSSFEDVPPERGTEAPYQETDFSRTRKDKKPDSSKEADIEEVARTPDAANSGSLPNPLYQQPFFDSVSDFSGFRRDSPGTEGAPPVRGFIEGETDEPTPKDEKKPHIPGGFDDDERDTVAGAVAEEPAFEPQLSKKEKKRREKEAKRVGSGTLDASEPSTPVNEREESIPEIPLSAKERKKLEKEGKRTSSGSFVESDPFVAEEATIEPPLSSKERKKREKETKRASVLFDTEPSTPAATREPEADDSEPPLSAKERKKREKAAKKAGIDPAYSEDPTPIVESPKAAETEATEYFPSTSKEEAAQNKQFEDGLRRIASTTSAVSLPSWSGDTVVSDVTAKPPSPELSRSEQKRAEKQAKKSGFSFADVTDTILASGGVVAAAAALNESAEDSTSGSSKEDKKKRKSKLGEASYDDPRDGPASMPGGWDSPERKSSPESSETVKEDTVDPFDTKSRETQLPKSVAANETPVPQEPEPSNDWFEPASSKKSKKKSKRSSVAFDSTPQVSSPLRSEVAWDDYIGTNGHDKAESEAARSDPITVIERKADDDVKSSRKSSTQDEFFDAGPRISESPRDMSPEDARSAASSGDADRESRRKSRREEARRASDYYDQPEYAYEAQSTISSEPADEEGRKKHKRRSRHEDDDTMSVSSSRRRSRHGDDDGDTRSVTSSRSRRDKEESPTQKKEKKGIFGSLFGRKSSESKEASRDTKQDDDDEERRRRKKKHRDSEYGDEEDDTKSVRSESHRRRHRSSDGKDDNDSRERRRRSTHEDDDKYSESGTRHHRRRRTDESGESLSRHRSHDSKSEHGDRPKHHRRRTDEDSYDTTRDQSFLGSRVEDLPPLPASRPDSPDTAVERMEGRPLEAASGTGLVSAAAAAAVGVAAGVAASAVSKKKKGGKGQKERNDEPDDIGVERAVEKAEYDGPLPSAAAHSFPLPYVPENKEMRLVGDEGVGVSSPNPPVLEQPARPVSVGRPGSSTAVPLRLPGHAPNTPGGKERAKSFSSPMAAASSSSLASPATPGSGKSRQSRPHSSDLKSGIMPLYLVERSRPVQEVEDSLPSLPSSKPSSRASSVHGSDEYESAREDFSVASSPARSRTRSLTLDTISANNFRSDEDILDSQQTTPKASEWPQTAIPWALPVAASGEKREKQQPQFYTWEDFAQDERMHEEERHADAAAEQSRDMSLPAESSISSSASPSKAKTLAAAAMLGTAAVYATRKGKDRSPERVEELNAQAPPPSAAAHSFPLPYIPQATLENVVPEVETTAKLQEAFEPISSAKKSKKKGKKWKKQQASGVATPEETLTVELTAGEQRDTGIAAEAEVVAEAVSSEDVENTPKAVDAQHDVVFPSAAAHTLPIVPVVDFPESRPELSRGGEEQALSQPSDAGYFTSAAVLSMPVYERPTEPVRNNEDKVSASSSYKLPELKAEPAPLVLEQRSVVVEPAAMVEVPEAPKLTRKQSKKDKKKAKRTSIFEDEPRGRIDEFAGPDVPPTVASAKNVEAEATPVVPVNFGLSDFGAVAAGAVTLWGLSQANAFQASMQNVRASKSESSEGNAVVPDAAPNEGSREIDDDRPAMATQDVFAPISSKKKSKKEKRKTKQTAALDDAPEAQADPVETADVAEPIAVAEAPQELPALGNEPSDVQKDFELEHDAWAAIPVTSKQSKGDNKNRRSAAAAVEDEVEIAQPGVDAQQVALGIDAVREASEVPEIHADAPRASDIAEATPTANVSNELPADGSEVQIEQKGVEPEANEWATPITSKQSRKDKKKRRSAATVEIQDEMTQPEVDAQQGTVDNEPVTATSIVPALLPADAEQSAVVVPAATKELAPEAENSEEMFPVTPKKGKKSKKHRKSLQQDESESGTPVKDEQQVQAADTVDTADDAERSLEPETVQLSVEEAAVDRDAPASGVTAVVEDLAPVSSKKKSKKDKRKSKTIALEEAEKPSEIIANDEGAAAKPAQEEVNGATSELTNEESEASRNAAPVDVAPTAIVDEPADAVKNSGNASAAAEPLPAQTDEAGLATESAQPGEDFWPTSSKKGKKKRQKQQHQELSGEQDAEAMTAPGEPEIIATSNTEKEIATAELAEADKASQNDSNKGETLALGASAAAVAVEVAALAPDEALPGKTAGEPVSEKAIEPEPEADNEWAVPSSAKKKSKKEKRKSKAVELDAQQDPAPDVVPANAPTDVPVVGDTKALTASVIEPAAEETPTLSRKQSKKDKKRKKQSLAFEDEAPRETETYDFVETPVAGLETSPAASDPAGETTYQADQVAAEEVPPSTETHDDSFHDAENFVETPTLVDSWHDAEDNALLTGVPSPPEPTPTTETFDFAKSAEDKEAAAATLAEQIHPVTAPTESTSLDKQDDLATPVAELEDPSMSQRNNLVDDVFGIASDSGDFTITPEDKPADHEEIMPDRGMEFEPERASEDMGAFGDATPRDSAEWSLGSSKKSGKKGKKGRKSASKADLPFETASSVPLEAVVEQSASDVHSATAAEAEAPRPTVVAEQEVPAIDAKHEKQGSLGIEQETPAPEPDCVELPKQDANLVDEKQGSAELNVVEVIDENAGTKDLADPIESTTGDALDVVAPKSSDPPKDELVQDANDISWAPTTKKKKGKKGKATRETETSTPTIGIPEADPKTAIESHIEVEEPVDNLQAAQVDHSGRAIADDTGNQITTTPAAPDAIDDFTWAPTSKRDKKKAKKLNKSGSQTPQNVEECSKATQSPAEQLDDGAQQDDVAAALVAVSEPAGSPHEPKSPEGQADQEEVSAESSRDLAASPLPANNAGVEARAGESSAAAQRVDNVNGLAETELDEWVPTSKKSRKGKKKQAVVDDLGSIEDKSGVDPERPDEAATDTPSMTTGLAVGGATIAAGLLASSMSHEADRKEEKETTTEEPADDVAWNSGSKKKGKKAKRASKLASEAMPVETEEKQTEEIVEAPLPTEETIDDTTNAEPVSREHVPERTAGESKEFDHEVSAEATNAVIVGLETQPAADDADDLWASTPSTKKKKSKKAKRSDVDAVTESKEESKIDVADEKLDAAAPEERTNGATDQAVASEVTALDGIASSEQKAVTSSDDIPVSRSVEEDAQTEAAGGQDVAAMADNAQAETTAEAPPAQDDDFATFASSKKRKGKKARKTDIWAEEEPAVDSTPSASLGATDTLKEGPAKSQPEGEATPVAELDDGQNATTELPDAAISDDFATSSTSKKKKGKKGRKADLWEFEERSTKPDLPASSKSIGDMPSEHQQVTAADAPVEERAKSQPQPVATAITDLDQEQKDIAELLDAKEDEIAGFATSKKKKGKKGHKADIWASEEKNIGTDVPESSKTIEKMPSEEQIAPADLPTENVSANEVPVENIASVPAATEETALDEDMHASHGATAPKESSANDILIEELPHVAAATEDLALGENKPASAEIPAAEEGDLANVTGTNRKKGKKSRKSGLFEDDVQTEPEAPIPSDALEQSEEQQRTTETISAEQQESAERKPTEPTEDPWAVSTSSKKKKGKKGEQSGSATPAVDVAELEASQLAETSKPVEKQHISAEIAAAEQDQSGESKPVETTEDTWALPASSKKKKGKKGRQSGSITPAVDVADQPREILSEEAMTGMPDVDAGVEVKPDAMSSPQPEETHVQVPGSTDLPSGAIPSLEGDTAAQNPTTDLDDMSKDFQETPLTEPAVAGPTEETTTLPDDNVRDQPAAPETDDWWSPQTSKKQKKKGKKSKSADVEAFAGPFPGLDVPGKPAPEEPNTEQASQGANDGQAIPIDEAAVRDAEITQDTPATENDGWLSMPMGKSGKKGKAKKGKRATQVSLDEQPSEKLEESRVDKDSDQSEAGLAREVGAADAVETPVLATASTDPTATLAAGLAPDVTLGDRTIPSTSAGPVKAADSPAPPASTPLGEEAAQLAVAENVPADEAVAQAEAALDTSAPETDDFSSFPTSKNKAKKGRKEKLAVSEAPLELQEASTEVEELQVEETVPQSTATTLQGAAEAETEDAWALPVNGKKGKKSKKLQQVVAKNSEPDGQIDNQESRAEPEMSTAGKNIANEADAEDFWSAPATGKKAKKQKKARREAELMELEDEPRATSSIELGDPSNGKHEAGPIDSAEALREVDVKSEPIESTPDAPITAEEDNKKLEAMEGDKSVTAEQFDNAAAKEPANGQREDDDVGFAAVGASAAIAATARSMDPGSEATTTDVQDWSSFSTKRSKRDKKKAKKTDPVTPQANEPAPASAEADEVVDATADAVSVDVESIQQGSSADTLTRSADFADDQSRTPTEAIVPTSVEDVAVASQDLHHAQTTAVSPPAAPLTQATDLAQSSAAADIDFTATVAAGLADSGFDPNLVINDPVFQRRASPTGSPEANPEEYVFAPAVSRRKTKGKRGKDSSDLTGTEVPEASRTVSSDEKRSSDVDEIVNKTLASTGFDASLLEKALEASNEQSKEQSGGDDEFALATTKRRKNKKSKRSTVEQSEESSGVPTSVEAIVADLDVQQSEQTAGSKVVEDTTTAEPKGPMEGSENGWMVQDEMDVDAMDKAYKAYKKNKRQQKKLKAKSAATSDNQESSAVEDTERSAPMSEVEDMSKRQAIRAGFEEQNDQPASALQPTEVQSPGSATSSKSLVESVFPGLERIKRRVPTRDAGADDGRSAREGEVDARSRALIHTSEVSQHLPTEVPRTPTPSGHAHDSKAGVLGPSGVAAGLAVAGAGLANARQAHGHADEHAASNRAMDTTEPSWSFAALGNEERSGASPTNDIRHDVIRDSGYETAKRTSQQTDRSSQEVPQIVRTSSSRDSLLQRRSLEPLRVSTPTSPDWEIHTPKQRRGKDSAREVPMHERTPSDKTPLEPTKAAPSPSPLHDQPSPSHRAGRHSTAQSATVPAEPSPALGSGGHRDRSALSPTSPRTHLDAIPEEHGHRRHPSKRSKSGAEIGGPEHVKAIKRTETPPRMRAQEQAITPQQHTQSTSAGKRSVSTPLSTSDEVFNRLPWPAVDQENDTVHLTRSHPRHSHATPDHRSASVLSDRSNASGNHFKAPQELRSYSRNSNGSSTPSLRRTSLSGDLRAASRRGGSDVGSLSGSLTGSAGGARASPHTISFEPPPTPPLEHDEPVNGSATRAMDTPDAVFVGGIPPHCWKDDTDDDEQQGYGDAQRSQVSPTRPPSVRKRQSMHINELESRLDLLTAENRALQEARQASETTRGFDGGSLQEALEARDLQLQAKDVEINQIRAMLLPLQEEIARLTELSNGLTEANRNLVDDTNGRYATLQAEHAEAHHKWQETVRELDSVRHEHGRVTSGMRDIVEAEIATALADKNAEILRLREQLDIAAEQIRALQVQIQSSTSTDFLVQRDEDYFDGACQKLCQHVQQWVLRFSKTSDNRICRLSTDLKDDKIEARLDNAVLDGSDVDKLLGDRVRRRDVFMSVVMTMVWEYVFTRYLFGMDREQRQKLKALEKLLAEVGPPRAVAHWRATTLTLLSKRPQFDEQCALDTEAVAHEIFEALCMLLPPPSVSRDQLQASLQKVLRIAVELAIEMRTQRAEYIMLPPLQPEYDTNGDLVRKVYFNASLMNERSGLFSSNEELAARQAVVKIVLFPLVVKKGDDVGEGDDEIVVCPAQVLVHNDGGRDRKIVRVMSGAMEIDEPIRSRQSMRSLVSEAPGGAGF